MFVSMHVPASFIQVHFRRAFHFFCSGSSIRVMVCTMNKCVHACTKDTYPISIKLCDIVFFSLSSILLFCSLNSFGWRCVRRVSSELYNFSLHFFIWNCLILFTLYFVYILWAALIVSTCRRVFFWALDILSSKNMQRYHWKWIKNK